MNDITTTIEDAITDATLPADPLPDVQPDPEPTPDPAPIEDSTLQVDTPADRAEAAKPPIDDFDTKFGLTPKTESGRDNRIPYSRVKKITEKALSDAQTKWSKDVEASHVPVTKFQELDTKVKDYESRLGQVAEFERVMTQDPVRFLQMLHGLPGYAQVFSQIAQPTQAPAATQPVEQVDEEGPQPDVDMGDGTKAYSMEGLKALRAYDRAQTAAAVLKQVEERVAKRYGPIADDYEKFQQVQKARPVVDAQIAEARTWKLFNESEAEIVDVLSKNKTFSLERAYQTVVLPKLSAEHDRLANESKVNRDAVRAEILKELKQAPRASSVSTGATRPTPVQAGTSGPRSLEDVIADSLKGLNG